MALDDQTHAPLPQLPPRRDDSHKGDYGRALVIGGSRGMSGAIALAGFATLRSGAGLVTLAVPREIQDVVATIEPSYMTHGLANENGQFVAAAADELIDLAKEATAVALGPGLGRGMPVQRLVSQLYSSIEKPMVVDADGLNALAQHRDVLTKPGGPRVLTPHPGELARLAGEPYDPQRRLESAAMLAQRDPTAQTIVVLKGHHTIITDGRRFAVNDTGNPGMASGGSGDVLTGVVIGFICQQMSPFDAARLAVHLHGLAGDLAADILGEVSLIASDIIDYLPQAIQHHARQLDGL